MKTIAISEHQADVIAMMERLGPDAHEYSVINDLVNSITDDDQAKEFRDLIQPILNENTLYGYTYLKPMGYAGDYMLIEKMYQQYASDDPRWHKWDVYYHTHEACKAVRNRKSYFVQLMENLIALRLQPVRVLILGSGPASDVNEFFERNPNAAVSFDLLDIDQRAIDYASNKNSKYNDRINYIKMNVLRFMPTDKYDLIWSAGLFDYLNDRYFVGLLNRFKNNLNPYAEMVIGNFSDNNPTRRVMEVIGQWYLLHRSSQKLTQLAINAGIAENAIYVDQEPLGINLFLRIKPDFESTKPVQVSIHRHIETAKLQQLDEVL